MRARDKRTVTENVRCKNKNLRGGDNHPPCPPCTSEGLGQQQLAITLNSDNSKMRDRFSRKQKLKFVANFRRQQLIQYNSKFSSSKLNHTFRHSSTSHTWELAWFIGGNLCYLTASKFRKFHSRPVVIVNTSNFQTHKSRHFNANCSFFLRLVGFLIAKLLF